MLASLAASGPLVFLYVRRLGGERVGAFVAGLGYALGPYLVGHLGDTATVTAAPLLPLLLLAAESHVNRGTPGRAAGLAVTLALVILAGSPEATRAAAALLLGRLLVAHLLPGPRTPRPLASVLAVAGGLALAAPQWLPTLLAARDAGRAVTGLASPDTPLPGFFGLVLRYASHTPAPALALAALPLAFTQTPVRVLGMALLISLALQWGRGPLAAAGSLAIVFDLTLCILAGLSLSAQWRARREPAGARLRAYFLVASLASAAALSVAAAVLGPLPETLAGAVGVLALSLILYFSLATSPHTLRAGIWLLPLTVSFLLQPYGRGAWGNAPTRAELYRGSGTREAVQRAMGALDRERVLTLVRRWPHGREADLAYANRAIFTGGRSANGYDPMVPLRTRDGARIDERRRHPPRRVLPVRSRAAGPARHPVGAGAGGPAGRRSRLDGARRAARHHPRAGRSAAVPAADGRGHPGRAGVVAVRCRLHPPGRARGRAPGPARLHRPRARRSTRGPASTPRSGPSIARTCARAPRIAGPPIAQSWPGPGGGFEAHLYEGVLPLPGRYYLDGISIERLPGRGPLRLAHLAVVDEVTRRTTSVALGAAYVSDTRYLVERATTPAVRLFEVPAGLPGPRRPAAARPSHRRRRGRRAGRGHAPRHRSACRRRWPPRRMRRGRSCPRAGARAARRW